MELSNIMKVKYLFVMILVFFACGNRQKIVEELSQLQSKSIILPQQSRFTIQGKDTVLMDFMKESRLKLLVFIDSSECSSCSVNKMFLWDNLIEYSRKYKGNLKFYFIFSPQKQDKESVQIALTNNAFDYPVFIDSLGEFERWNPHLPKNKALHTFLLDENNNVILVGNPLHNKKIEEMFYKVVEEKLGKPNDSTPYNN